MLILPPLSLYIHIPWCIKKCPYCDFNSHEFTNLPEKEYVAALVKDLQQDESWVQGRKIHSVFFGGGTPSLFSARAIGDILQNVEQRIGFEENVEITLEANPGSFEQQKFEDYRQAGINRLSIGVQSFQQKYLQALGRIHNDQEALRAISMAKNAGFNNINLDLMHGLPHQNLDEALDDLSQAIDCEPEHISWYQLTIEPNTFFYRQPPNLPVDDVLVDIQMSGEAILARHGFINYEVSAFSQPDKRSRHNVNYWMFGDYLGLGAGAHGKVTDINSNTVIRRHKTRAPSDYLSSVNYKEKIVDTSQLTVEFMMNALRLQQGVSKSLFEERTGLEWDTIESIWSQLVKEGLMEDDPSMLRATRLGQRLLNSLLASFIE